MTMLSIIQDAALHIGIPKPSAVASSTATDAMQLLRLLNAGASQLMKDHHWSKLLKVKTFTGVAAQAQTGQPPANFDRFALGDEAMGREQAPAPRWRHIGGEVAAALGSERHGG